MTSIDKGKTTMAAVRNDGPKEIIGIDLIRFMCAFLVMTFHLFFSINLGLKDDVAHGQQYAWASYGWAGVELFFVISGFIIPYSAEGRSPFTFVRSRIVRLAPGLWICATLSMLAMYAVGFDTAGLPSRYIRSFAFFPVGPWISGVYWTLFVEIAFYLAILLLLITDRFRQISVFATALGCVTLMYWSAYFSVIHGLLPDRHLARAFLQSDFSRTLDLSLVHHGAFFGLGINLWLLTRKSLTTARMFSSCVCALAGVLEIIHDAGEVSRLSNVSVSPLPPLALYMVGIAGIIVSVKYNRQISNVWETIRYLARLVGLTTYPMYLIHIPIGNFFVYLLLKNQGFSFFGAAWCSVFLVIASAAIIARFAEPAFQKRLRQLIDAAGLVLDHGPSKLLFARTEPWSD